MPTAHSLVYDADGRLAGDLPCVCCGHNLRGLLPTAVCTECATPISWTLRGSELYACEPGWVDRLRSGVACLALTLPFLWFPLAWLVYGVGLWRLSTPEPIQRSPREIGLLAFVRVTLIAGASLLLTFLVFQAWDPELSLSISLRFGLAIEWVWFALVVGWAAAQLSTIALIWRLARRHASPRLSRLCKSVLYSHVVALALVALGCVDVAAQLGVSLLRVLGVTGLAVALLTVPFIWITLLVAWRVLHVAEIQARRSRCEVRAWQNQPPGSAWLARQSATTPDAPTAAAPDAT